MDEKQSAAAYIKGFNEGYLITQYLPELSQKLSGVEATTSRIEGFKDGRQQYALDYLKVQRQLWAQREPSPSPENNPHKDRDINLDR